MLLCGLLLYDWLVKGTPGYDTVQWYKDREWYSIGYASSQSPSVAGIFTISDVVPDPNYRCNVLTTDYFANSRWSGGPAFSEKFVNGKSFDVRLGAVVTNCISSMPNCSSGGNSKTILAGGMRIGALVTLGILQWDANSWGFDKSPQ